ncbi:MAG: AAA family ATPase [Flavobacteriaceae bacterium]|nr:AAA family ATPase [Flavobacteriaceae bacterium]
METTERLYLKNFGPIKELDIEIKPLMVFIGESGSGKSAILKLMSLLRWIHKQNNLRTYFVKSKIAKKADYSRLVSDSLLRVSGLKEFMNSNTEIRFQIGETIYENKGKIPTDAKIKGELTLDKVAFISENRGVLPDIYANKIPRGLKLSYYLEDTYNNFLFAFDKLDRKDFFIESTQLTLFEKKGGMPMLYVKGDSINNGKFELKLENASSGTKTSVYTEIITSYLTQRYEFKQVLEGGFNDFLINKIQESRELGKTDLNLAKFSGKKNLSIFIEEPELSLFPAAQRRLINRLVKDCFVENKQENCTTRLAFATHSPYIVNHLNLLMEAFDRENTVFTDGAAISYDDLGVWLIQEGKLRDLKARNKHFIDVMPLSDDINDIYEKYKILKDG